MAKVRSNNSKPVNPQYRTSVYTEEQHKDMDSRFGGDVREKAAAMKEDIQGSNPPKRYSPGTEGYKKAQETSEENMIRKGVQNRTQGNTSGAPGSYMQREISGDKAKQPSGLQQVSESSADAQKRRELEKRRKEAANPLFINSNNRK